MTQQLFTGLTPSASHIWNNVNYIASPGLLGGTQQFAATVLFLSEGAQSGEQHIWGNIDTVAFQGWQILISDDDSIIARIGDGSAITELTFSNINGRMNRWILAELAFGTNLASLYVNGSQAQVATGLNPFVAVPGGVTSLGSRGTARNDPFFGTIAGATYSTVGFTDPFTHAEDVARTGQLAQPGTYGGARPDNSWEAAFHNMDGSALWLPTTGTVNLARNGTAELAAVNAPANLWF